MRVPTRTAPRFDLLVLLAALAVILLLLACTGAASMPQTRTTAETPSWACPSPTPKPYGETGPVKDVIIHTRPISEGGDWPENVYYVAWEQEYATLGGPPFPSPTPYVVAGTTYSLGQRVHLPPLYALVEAQPGSIQPDGRMLYRLVIIWTNPLTTAVEIDYPAQVQISAITQPDGGTRTGEGWGVSAESMQLGHGDLPTRVPPGESVVQVPILAPAGAVQTVDIRLVRDTSYAPSVGGAPSVPGAPTPTEPPPPTPTVPATPNTTLRGATDNQVVVQFVRARPVNPPCGNPGATTGWATSGFAINGSADAAIAAPPGASRVVQVALQQVGRPYVWGAAGPGAFDCSGLAVWAYAQAGLRVGWRVSADQYAHLTPVAAAQIQPGDLVFFAERGSSKISHVGMLAGDVNGDGKWDLVHAASPALGVRMDYDILGSSYYGNPATCTLCVAGFRTMR